MIDPIKNNLIFERFLNIERKTMPDIDVDIEDIQRPRLLNYLNDKYGIDKVCNIITFQRMKAKMALTDTGRVLGLDVRIVKAITSLFGVQHDEDIMAAVKNNEKIKSYYTQYPKLFELSHKLIGFPRNYGMHAAGVVICNEDISNVIPVIYNDGTSITQFEMGELEEHGLIKLDILSLNNLTIIKQIVNKINEENKGLDLKIENIEIDNKDVFKQLSLGDTVGIFQLESQGMTSVVKRIRPKNIEDISLVLALYRPGAVGMVNEFYENMKEPSKVKYLNDNFKKILSSTYGIVVYQEQLMEIIKSTCNYT